jgi:putative NADH-flavin reductase
MKVLVLGANGKVGTQVTKLLLQAGHDVVAFTHGKNLLPKTNRLTVIQGDVKQKADITHALQGCDAVISTLGSWGTPTKDILSKGMEQLIPAMQEQGVNRIVSLTGSAAMVPSDNWSVAGKLARFFLHLIAPKILDDGEQHIALLMASNLEWTVVRSPVMNNWGVAAYTLTNKLPGALETINRAAVAEAMVDQLSDQTHLRQAPHIHRA